MFVFGRSEISRTQLAVILLLGLTALALYLCYILVAPFLKPILFAVIFAVVFYPAHAGIRRRIRSPNAAAALSTTAVIVLIGGFTFFVGRALISGLQDIYEYLSGSGQSRERLVAFIVHFLDQTIAWASHYVRISVPDLQRAVLSEGERIVSSVLGATAGFLGALSSFGLNTFIAAFVLFFLLRDGKSMLRRAAFILPLRVSQARRMFSLVRETLHAIVYGTLAMAAIQGALTALAFWFLGLNTPVVWGLLATVLAVLPVVGTTLVWLPAAAMLVVGGYWMKGIVLTVWGLAVVHPIDNVVRPYLIGGRVKLSTMYVFFAVVGGLKAFGAVGLFLGPLILSITVALFTFIREERHSTGESLRRHNSQGSVSLDKVVSIQPNN
jgi:predicted PurR-regulated permease PerM